MKFDLCYVVIIVFLLVGAFFWGQIAVLKEKVAWLESEALEIRELSILYHKGEKSHDEYEKRK